MQVNAGTAGHCSYFLVCVSTFLLFAFEYPPNDQRLKSGSTSWPFLRSLEEYIRSLENAVLYWEGGGAEPEKQSFISFLGFKDGFYIIFRIQKETKKC